MNWTKTSYNTETSGAYAITGHAIMTEPGGAFYIAWHGKQELGTHPTAEAAREACARHAEGQ